MSGTIPQRQRIRTCAGVAALGLAMFSGLCALTVRDVLVPTEMVFFGGPWLVRWVLVAAAWVLLRPKSRKWRALMLLVAVHALIQAAQSFRWQPNPLEPAGSFEVTLWNAGRNLWKMPREWPALAGPDTKLVVLVEAGSFSDSTWQAFTACHPDLTWQRLDGGIVVGVRGRILASASLGDRPQFRCHRVRVEIDGLDYTVVAVDIPSPPWLSRQPYLERIHDVSSPTRCLILGDFNTPPTARGFDRWRSTLSLANESQTRGFQETWCYGMPLLTLDQLWLSADLVAVGARQTATLRSDHVRMTFRIKAR